MKRPIGFRVLGCLVVGVVLHPPAPLTAQTYTVPDLGVLPGGPGSSGRAVNDAGHVAGVSGLPPNGIINHAFLWVDGNMTDLGTLGGLRSAAFGINNQGQVVGGSEIGGGGSAGFIWEDGVMTELTSPSGSAGSGEDINDAGQVTGGKGESAYIWEDGELIELGTLPGFDGSLGFGINAAGEVVGSAYSCFFCGARGFHWVDGVMSDLGTIPGFASSVAFGINDVGQIVGFSNQIAPSAPRATLWDSGEIIDLGIGKGNQSMALEVNNAGVIVGYWGTSEQIVNHFACKWEDGELIDLHDVIPSDPGWVLLEAYDINEVGQIVGGGFNPDGLGRGFLLTPCAPADFECDGNVGPIDLAQLLASWGPCPDPADCPADLNADGSVGPIDLAMLLASWG